MLKTSRIENQEYGMSLIEVLVVLSMLAVVVAAISPHLRGGRQVWEVAGDRHADVLQNARIGMDMMTRELKQAWSISDAGGDYIEFVDKDENDMRFQHGSGYLEYGSPGNLNTLAGPVDSLSFTYYKEDGITEAATPDEIRSALIQLTTSDSEGIVSPITLSSLAFVRKDPAEKTIVINEIMYNPSETDNQWEWVELYNCSSADIDVSGWQFNNKNMDSFGSVVISAGGYATITRKNSLIHWIFLFFLPPSVSKLHVNGNMGMGNNGDTITIWDDSGVSVDSVSYDDAWGGDGNDRTLERIDPQGDSNDSGNWEEGSIGGTPGAEN